MKTNTFIAMIALSLATPLVANEIDEKYFTIESVEVTEVAQYSEPSFFLPQSRAFNTDPIDEVGIILDKIIAIGDKIWKIIEKNKPVVDQNYQAMSLVPQGIRSWDQLGTWSTPQVRVFKMVYKNGYGMKVVEFDYRVAFTHSGSFNGKGKYLSRVEVEPATLNVAWGYKFSGAGEILNTTNAGTTESPIAAMELRMNWTISTVLKHMQQSTRFYVRGDGLFLNLSDGNMPSNLQ